MPRTLNGRGARRVLLISCLGWGLKLLKMVLSHPRATPLSILQPGGEHLLLKSAHRRRRRSVKIDSTSFISAAALEEKVEKLKPEHANS